MHCMRTEKSAGVASHTSVCHVRIGDRWEAKFDSEPIVSFLCLFGYRCVCRIFCDCEVNLCAVWHVQWRKNWGR